ncbi:uncharacterized protein IL334_006742 [Kwoniella shivajii]|uniref:Uncharacterized protein n=1 Tax=Kwoniella shivajii TaxID=564305 RepID=A0ABZ1D7F3_9TREE|nr:hypothetical protein IL334_006742 [Kwoniella shivajii]
MSEEDACPLKFSAYLNDGWATSLLRATENPSTSRITRRLSLNRPSTSIKSADVVDGSSNDTVPFEDHPAFDGSSKSDIAFRIRPEDMREMTEDRSNVTKSTLQGFYVVEKHIGKHQGISESINPVSSSSSPSPEKTEMESYHLHIFTLADPATSDADTKKLDTGDDIFSHLKQTDPFSNFDTIGCNVRMKEGVLCTSILTDRFTNDS